MLVAAVALPRVASTAGTCNLVYGKHPALVCFSPVHTASSPRPCSSSILGRQCLSSQVSFTKSLPPFHFRCNANHQRTGITMAGSVSDDSSPRVVHLTPIPISSEAFAPYGQVVTPSEDGEPYGDEDAALDLSQGQPR